MTIRELLDELRARAQDEAARAYAGLRGNPSDSEALAEFIRPNLGNTPAPLKRWLEPIVAGAALLALLVVLSWGALNLAMLFLAAGVAYAIITFVFGIELDLNMPA